MQSGSSSQSGRNRGAAVEADAIEEQQLEADAIGGAVEIGEEPVEADAIGEQQLCTESSLAPDYSRRRTRGK